MFAHRWQSRNMLVRRRRRLEERTAGTSWKKFETLTSLMVDPQVMLYETKCAINAVVRCQDMPEKKKKKKLRVAGEEREKRRVSVWREAAKEG
jgi:hypothetical protein